MPEQIFVAQDTMMFLVDHAKELKKNGIRVAMKLICQVDFGNRVEVDLVQMGEELHIKVSAVQKALQQLIDLNVIAEGPRSGTTRMYRFNPAMAWKGDLEDQPKGLEEWQRRERLQVVREPEPAIPEKKPRRSSAKKKRTAEVIQLSERKTRDEVAPKAHSDTEDTPIS